MRRMNDEQILDLTALDMRDYAGKGTVTFKVGDPILQSLNLPLLKTVSSTAEAAAPFAHYTKIKYYLDKQSGVVVVLPMHLEYHSYDDCVYIESLCMRHYVDNVALTPIYEKNKSTGMYELAEVQLWVYGNN